MVGVMYEPAARRRNRTERTDTAAADIVAALERLLASRSIEAITVAEILDEANVARGTFYFWFTSKYDVAAHAHRAISAQIIAAAAPWFEDPDSRPEALVPVLQGLVAMYATHAPVLRAVSETWHSQPEVHAAWTEMFGTLIDHLAHFIERQQERGIANADLDAHLTAEALVWMNERTLYMASAGAASEPLGDDLANTLANVWSATLYTSPVRT